MVSPRSTWHHVCRLPHCPIARPFNLSFIGTDSSSALDDRHPQPGNRSMQEELLECSNKRPSNLSTPSTQAARLPRKCKSPLCQPVAGSPQGFHTRLQLHEGPYKVPRCENQLSGARIQVHCKTTCPPASCCRVYGCCCRYEKKTLAR